MRILFTILIAAGVLALHALDNPAGFKKAQEFVVSSAGALWNDKDIRIDGLKLLSRTEIERLLPLDRSVLWWRFNDTEIQAKLEQNPWVGESKVVACPDAPPSQWGCFLVSISERVPTFLATVDETSWVIDREGSFIAPLSDLRERAYRGELIAVSGLASRSASPDMVRAQLATAARLLDTLEREVRRPIERVEFLAQGDFSVIFKGLDFPTVFAAGSDAKVPLLEQGTRCAELLKRLGSRLSDVERIDLAFDRVGVVKFKEPEPQAGTESAKQERAPANS
ncbi:MAG: cell division protein FtsQ/DivIB [Pseudomonadota bacterium]|jgi:hypothetical protein